MRVLRSRAALSFGLVVCSGVLLLCLLASVRFGAARIGTWEVIGAFVDYGGSEDDLIIRTLRVPRALIAALVGAALAVAGAIIQGLTRNPLSDPGILGIEAGAALAVVGSVFLLGASSLTTYALFAFVGAAVAAVVVYGLGTLGGGMNPMKLVVAGAALAALLSSLTTAVLIFNQRTLEEIRFWLAGSVAGRDLGLLLQVLPYVFAGLLLAFVLGRQITALTLGEDVATGLGQRTAWVKSLSVAAVVLLAGSAVAIAGPVGFVGLVVPHVARFFVGVDYRWILPYSALLGAILLVSADIAARVALRPQELPLGVMTALVGAPVFIYLARKRSKG
ncbi:iron chelate uptake ABC transporter family permease subunit [Rubrobacter tropicus]|uniref:Iron chelate uptake ABC transporter family permease subunit n=1 Tax=Rubrobacter tropicus TaxID=2653851 RepID=A0A6G8Q5A8_9ACTN|nr:iron ABC transporter permease [Rubrobacter tropicus]QIN81662.1 iron chelate uptake ABC transporter family permease subunit [Rubrobacter tropicus]